MKNDILFLFCILAFVQWYSINHTPKHLKWLVTFVAVTNGHLILSANYTCFTAAGDNFLLHFGAGLLKALLKCLCWQIITMHSECW